MNEAINLSPRKPILIQGEKNFSCLREGSSQMLCNRQAREVAYSLTQSCSLNGYCFMVELTEERSRKRTVKSFARYLQTIRSGKNCDNA